MQQPPGNPTGHWSPDRQWWWDGSQWIAAAQAPVPAPPLGPPMLAPVGHDAGPSLFAPSPGLRTFLLVVLVITSVFWGLLTTSGVLGIAGGATETGSIVFFSIIAFIFAISLIATIGVFARASWARWAAIAAGVASSLTCLGLVLGIPILVAAARAPGLGRRPARA